MDSNENKKGNKKKYLLISLIVVLVIAGAVYGIMQYMNYSKEKEEKTLSYTELITKLKEEENSVEKIEMKKNSTTVKVKLKDEDEERETIVPETEAFIEYIQDQIKDGKSIELVQKEENIFVTIGEKLLSLLPTIILLVLIVMIFQMQGLGEKGKVYDATTQKT
jgi:ATP-dependent Zn protease